jgi:hypothetical protein
MYSAIAITTTPDNSIIIESPHSTPAIVKDVETTDILKLSARSEFTASFRFSIVADPTNPTQLHQRKLMRTSNVTSLIVSSSKMKMMDMFKN